jgi:hypothetical protein
MPLLDEEDEGVVDDILNTLREGSVFRHRRLGTASCRVVCHALCRAA